MLEIGIIYAYKIMNNDLKEKISIMKRDNLTDADYYITNFHNGKKTIILEKDLNST